MLRVLFVAGLAAAVTFDVEFEDRRVMHKPVDGDHRHAGVGEQVIMDPRTVGLQWSEELIRSSLSAICSNRTLVSAWFLRAYDRSSWMIKSKRSRSACAEGNCRLWRAGCGLWTSSLVRVKEHAVADVDQCLPAAMTVRCPSP